MGDQSRHVADDFGAIARRLKEIEAERQPASAEPGHLSGHKGRTKLIHQTLDDDRGVSGPRRGVR